MHAEPRPTTSDHRGRWLTSGTAGTPPLVAIHTWHDEQEHYDLLAAAADVDIVSVLPPSPDDGPLPRRTHQWVDYVIGVLQSMRLGAPYRFIGWSFGGLVAVELARRLRADGYEVSYVGMVDSVRPRAYPVGTSEYVWFHLTAAAAMDDDRTRIAYLTKKGFVLLRRQFPRASALTRATLERVGLGAKPEEKPPVEKPTDPLAISVHVSYLNYHAPPVDFPVTLYATEPTARGTSKPVLRWGEWLNGGYELVWIPGGHFSLWDEANVGALGAALRRSLSYAADTHPDRLAH